MAFVFNSVVRLLAFAAISWLAAEGGRLTRELERTVKQRTHRLQREVEEHKTTARMLNEASASSNRLPRTLRGLLGGRPGREPRGICQPRLRTDLGEAPQRSTRHRARGSKASIPKTRGVTAASLTKQLRGDYDEEYRVVRPDGSVRWVHDRAFPVRNQAGVVYRVVGIAADITEHKRSEHLLQAQRNMAVALSSTSDLKYAVDRLLEVALQLEGIDCGAVYLAHPETNELHLEAHRGLSASFLARHLPLQGGCPGGAHGAGRRNLLRGEEQIPRSLEVLWGSKACARWRSRPCGTRARCSGC